MLWMEVFCDIKPPSWGVVLMVQPMVFWYIKPTTNHGFFCYIIIKPTKKHGTFGCLGIDSCRRPMETAGLHHVCLTNSMFEYHWRVWIAHFLQSKPAALAQENTAKRGCLVVFRVENSCSTRVNSRENSKISQALP